MTGDHRVGWGWLGYVALEFMCAEGFWLVCNSRQAVNHINEIFWKFFPGRHRDGRNLFLLELRDAGVSLEAPGAFRSGEILRAGFAIM